MVKKLIFLLIVICFHLNSAEVFLESFQGYKGNFLPISPLKTGKIDNSFLEEQGIHIEITRVDMKAGSVDLELTGNPQELFSIELIASPEIKDTQAISTKYEIKEEAKKTLIRCHSEEELGEKSYLKLVFSHPCSRVWCLKNYPIVTLLVKDKEFADVNRYQVKIHEALDDTGTPLQLSNPPHVVCHLAPSDSHFSLPFEKDLPSQENDEVTVSFYLNETPINAKKITYVNGEITFETPQTQELHLDLVLGPIQHPDLKNNEIEMEVVGLADKEVHIAYSNPQNKPLKIELDPKGESHRHLSHKIETVNGHSTFIAKSDLALEKLELKVTFSKAPPLIKRVPFELKDLPLRNLRRGTFW